METLNRIPGHILQKVNDRIQRAVRKNAALDSDNFQTLNGKLEYFDLREIEETITSKSLWPYYEQYFNNKDIFLRKFDQLAELRNGIRHSRNVDDVTRKEGEAAILWFNHVFEKH